MATHTACPFFRGAFAERFPGNGAIAGVRLHVSKQTPGHYMPGDARAESIAKDPKLGLGCEALYVEFDEDSAVERFIEWCEKRNREQVRGAFAGPGS